MTPADSEKDSNAFDYDRFVDWPKRLDREGPFFRSEFEARGVHSVVDAGCGTGRHAALFASWGLDVTGVDPSASMLAQARAHASETGVDVRFLEGGFGEMAALGLGPTDALVCTGNALPHVDGLAGLREALTDFAEVMRTDGLLVLHLLNHDRLMGSGGTRVIPPVIREGEDGTWVFLRVMDVAEGAILFDFVTLHRPPGAWDSEKEWEVASRRSRHAAMPHALLVRELEAAGFSDIRLYGDHSRKAFDPGADESVILTAVKA